MEIALVLAVGAAVISGAAFLAQGWRQNLGTLGEASGVPVHVAALRNAVENWYRWEYCHADPERIGVTPAPRFPIESGIVDVATYLTPVPGLPDPGQDKGEYDWEIVRSAQTYGGTPPPRLRVFWDPPERFDDRISLIARDLEAVCDSDGNADTREPCGSGRPGERLFWPQLLAVRAEERAHDDLRVNAWLTRNGIECLADGYHLRLNTSCDSDGDGQLGPDLDQDGDGLDDAWRLDADGDGALDFDLTRDLVVDVSDFRVMGC